MVRVPGPEAVLRSLQTPQVAGGNIRPAQISPRAARSGLVTLGNAISAVGGHLDELQRKRQDAEDTLAIAEKRNFVNQQFDQLNDTLTQRSGEEGFDPTAFTKSSIDSIQQNALDGLSPKARQRFEPSLVVSLGQKGIALGNREHARAVTRAQARFQDVITSRVNKITANPDALPDLLSQTQQELDDLHASGLLTADQLRKRKQEISSLYNGVALEKISREDASAAVRSFLFGYTPPKGKAGEIQSAIANEFHNAGMSSLLGLVLVDIETGGKFDPNIRPIGKDGKPLSSARGLFQFLNATGADYGLGPNATAAEQIRAGVKFTQDNINHLKTVLGRDPELVEVYFAHFLGRGGASALLQANPNQAMSTVLKGWSSVAKANRLPPGMTAGQFVAKFESRIERSAKKFDKNFTGDGSAMSRLGQLGISKEDVLRLPPSQFGALVKGANANLRVDLQDKITDATAMIGATGSQDVITETDREDITRVFGAERAEKIFRGFALAQQRFSDTQQLTQMTPAERVKFVNDLKPKAEDGGEGFAARQERFQNAQKAAKAVDDGLAEDAYSFAVTSTEEGRLAQSQFNSAPNGADGLTRREAAVDALLNTQRRLGAAENSVKILSGPLAERFVEQMNAVTTRQDAAAFLTGLRQTYGRHFPRVFREMVAKGGDPRMLSLETVSGGQIGIEVLETLAVERNSKDGKKFYQNRSGEKKADVDGEITKQLAPFLQTLPPGSVQLSQGYIDTIRSLTFKRLAEQGGEISEVVAKVARDVVLDRVEVIGRVGIMRNDVTLGQEDNTQQVEQVARILDHPNLVLREVRDLIDTSRAASIFPLPPDVRATAYIRDIEQQGQFVNSADGQGVNLIDHRGSLVRDKTTGQRLFVSWDQLEGMAGRLRRERRSDQLELNPAGRLTDERGVVPSFELAPKTVRDPGQIDPERLDLEPDLPDTRRDPAVEGIPETVPSPEQRQRTNELSRRLR